MCRKHLKHVKDAIVATLDVIKPGNAALLRDALQSSILVDKELGTGGSADHKYLKTLAETDENASSWDTRRQVLSIIADLFPFKRLQRDLPGVTEYQVKIPRKDKNVFGHKLRRSASIKLQSSDVSGAYPA